MWLTIKMYTNMALYKCYFFVLDVKSIRNIRKKVITI